MDKVTIEKSIAARCSAIEETRRAKLQKVPDPMELARLAVTLKPELATGNAMQQRKALAFAKGLFELAVDVAAEPTAGERKKAMIDVIQADAEEAVRQELAQGTLSYDPKAKSEDGLQRYLRQQKIKAPKSYRGHWGNFVKDYGFEEDGQWKVLRTVVDEEVARNRKEAAERKALKRGAAKSTKNQSIR